MDSFIKNYFLGRNALVAFKEIRFSVINKFIIYILLKKFKMKLEIDEE